MCYNCLLYRQHVIADSLNRERENEGKRESVVVCKVLEESEEVCWKVGLATGEAKRREEKRREDKETAVSSQGGGQIL
jgi:hypothetical protein